MFRIASVNRFNLIAIVFSLATLWISSGSSSLAEGPADTDVILTNVANEIVKEGGYVHPSLQVASPAPCGADRGMIFAKGPQKYDDGGAENNIWLRVPFSYQLTRNLALETLTPLVPSQILEEAPLITLDDAALLVLLLVHLRGNSAKGDKWHPFLASLPDNPGCGWWGDLDKKYERIIPTEVISSSLKYVTRVSQGMAQDYGPYLANEHWPKEWKESGHSIYDSAALAIKWALCIVSSRGTASSPDYGGGSVRLVPLADMFNHNIHSDGFIELTYANVGPRKELAGSFEVRRKDGIMPGNEITVDYTLDEFYPEDWFLSHGFVPSEVLDNLVKSEL